MGPSKVATSPLPLSPRSPAQQNVPGRSPFGKALPLRKPSLKEAVPSPQKMASATKAVSQVQPADSPPAAKRRRIEPAEYDIAEQLNHEVERKYVRGKFLGEGTYAMVYKGHLRSDPNHLVAMKRFKINKEMTQQQGIAVDVVREVKYLQELRHENIIGLYDVFSSKDNTISAVIQFCKNGSMEDLIKDHDISYGLADIKSWMGMLLKAVYYCHQNFVLHRDLKPGNILIYEDGTLKLTDFGLARSFAGPREKMTYVTITLWYRPPELLFGATHYSGKVDVWGVGMILAELLIRRPYIAFYDPEKEFEASGNEMGQLGLMNKTLGTPKEENWPGVSKLPLYYLPEPDVALRNKRYFREVFGSLDDAGLDFIRKLMTYDPRHRPTSKECLEDEWWKLEPRPTEPDKLPKKRIVDEKSMAKQIAKEPGAVENGDKFKGVARKLDFGGMKK